MSSAYGKQEPNLVSCYSEIYQIYCKLLQSSLDKKAEFDEFMSEFALTIDILEGETPASLQGMSGQYYLLEYEAWSIYSIENLFEKNVSMRGKPKDIVVMKDGMISKHHFEDQIGGRISLKYVGKEEKQRIVDAYEKFKKN